MKNRNFALYHRRNNRHVLTVKLALKTPKQNFSESMLQDITDVMAVDLKIVSKLTGIDTDRFDWYIVTILGTFDDLIATVVCWEEIGIQHILATL
jgi:hypothetical protein